MKCKKMQEKEKANLQLFKKKKVQKLKEKGITLIALVVTIIILLILTGVTLNMALSGDGLFSKARNAADKYKKAQEDETDLIGEIEKEMYSEYIGAFVTGYNPVEKTDENLCTIGTDTSGYTSEQKFKTEEMKWRIWDYDGTTLRLISDKPTSQELLLNKVNGYNNGVWAINEICRQCYSNNETGVTVRNLRRSDIEEVSNYDYTKYNFGSGELMFYGYTASCEKNYKAPLIWEKYDQNWEYKYDRESKTFSGNPSCIDPWEQEFESKTETELGITTNTTIFKQSSYFHDYLNKLGEFKNSKYYDLLFKEVNGKYFNKSFWLATRTIGVGDDNCGFGLANVTAKDDKCQVGRGDTYASNRRN